MSQYVVKRHKGRSGKSVYEWRVYAVNKVGVNDCRTITTQLAKFRSEEPARLYQAQLAGRDIYAIGGRRMTPLPTIVQRAADRLIAYAAYYDGRFARAEGGGRTIRNPFPPVTLAAREWQRGYDDEAAERSNPPRQGVVIPQPKGCVTRQMIEALK